MITLSINKYFVCEVLENYLSQVGLYYTASKSNQKRLWIYFTVYRFFFLTQLFKAYCIRLYKKTT